MIIKSVSSLSLELLISLQISFVAKVTDITERLLDDLFRVSDDLGFKNEEEFPFVTLLCKGSDREVTEHEKNYCKEERNDGDEKETLLFPNKETLG